MTGTAPKIVGWFESWSDTGFSAERMDAAASRDATPLLTWHSWDHRLGTDQPKYALRTIARGDHDTYVRQWAKDAADYGKPIYLRFDHEMNLDSFPWGVGANGNTAAEYMDAWRHVHGIFRQEGAVHVRWVWCPNVDTGSSTPFYQIYPGDEYVDWVGLDGYNWGTSQSWSSWQRFTEIFKASYDELAALTDKPMMIGEMASTEVGGNFVNGGKPNWIRQTYLNEIPSSEFEQIEAVMWFHEDKETNWLVDSSAAALEAYKEAVSAALYQGRLP
jgi:beta-mannanase